MARKRRLSEMHAGELNLVAMIDVAFQLLNFFLITTHPVDIFTNLDIFRPEAQQRPPDVVQSVIPLELMVYRDGYVFQKVNVSLREIDRQLTKIAGNNKDLPVIIKCTGDSSHAGLVNILDLCAKAGLTKISVFSM